MMYKMVPVPVLLFNGFVAALFTVAGIRDSSPQLSDNLILATIVVLSCVVIWYVWAGVRWRAGFRAWQGSNELLVAESGPRWFRHDTVFAVSLCIGIGFGVFSGIKLTNDKSTCGTTAATEETEVKLEKGDPLPLFVGTGVDGEEWRLDTHIGEPLLIHFWRTNDDVAAGQMLRLRRLLEEHRADTPQIVGVCLDWGDSYSGSLPDELEADWPQLFEPTTKEEQPILSVLGIERRRSFVWVVGSEGTLAGRDLYGGMIDLTLETLLRDERFLHAEAPDITTTTLDGEPWRLADQRGRVVVLDFWATWCGPCKAETPNLERLHDRFGSRSDFVLVGISLDEEVGAPRSYSEDNELPWVQLIEPGAGWKNSAAKAFGIRSIPSIWVIDAAGRVVAIDVRGKELQDVVTFALGPGTATPALS